jgi:hypothetical protein
MSMPAYFHEQRFIGLACHPVMTRSEPFGLLDLWSCPIGTHLVSPSRPRRGRFCQAWSSQLGARNPLDRHLFAFVSTASFSVRLHLSHLKVRRSKPSREGLMLVSINLAWHFGQKAPRIPSAVNKKLSFKQLALGFPGSVINIAHSQKVDEVRCMNHRTIEAAVAAASMKIVRTSWRCCPGCRLRHRASSA